MPGLEDCLCCLSVFGLHSPKLSVARNESFQINLQILEWLMEDQDFFQDLFQRLKYSQPGSDAQVEIVAFLQELTNLSKCLQQGPKRVLFQKLVHLGLFEVGPAP